jgi:glycosyltransferase involved in cell wall biosynthesis
MITVLIPTFNRPHLLRIALDSVARQTYLQHISKVIVSENGHNINSKYVCDEFPQLNIEYVYQEHQLLVLEHLKWLMSRIKIGYIAFLCDDDWWNTYHIELAIRSFERKPDCIAYFSNFVYANDEYKVNFVSYLGAKLLSIEGGKEVNYDLQKYEKEDIFLFSFILTPFHFSALVSKAEYLVEAVNILDEVHPTYSDRALWPVLSLNGEILFNPLATSIVRSHPNQDSNNYSTSEWRNRNQEGSLYVLELANKSGIEIKNRINHVYDSSNLDDRYELNNQLEYVFIDRSNLVWYKGYEYVTNLDRIKLQAEKRENSFVVSASRKVRKILRKFM